MKYVGAAKGVELGGELQLLRTTMKLKGAPLDIPDFIEIDINDLDRGDSLTYGDLTIPKKVEMLDNATSVCVSVANL